MYRNDILNKRYKFSTRTSAVINLNLYEPRHRPFYYKTPEMIIVKNGNEIYKDFTDFNVKDDDYESMKYTLERDEQIKVLRLEMQRLTDENKVLIKDNSRLKHHIDCQPDGKVFKEYFQITGR